MGELVDAGRAIGLPFEGAESGRWIRFGSQSGETVYVVEYACDDDCQMQYILFRCSAEVQPTTPPMKFTTIGEALREAQILLASPKRQREMSDRPTARVPNVVP
jgi:hypothetical protein